MPIFFLTIFGVLALDQGTKILVRSQMPLGAEIPILPFFSLTHVHNTGIAFGMFQGNNLFFLTFGSIVTFALVYYAIQLLVIDRASSLALGVILGGAVGNLIDRIVYGRVTDFLDFYIGLHHWPVFNIADSAICVGAAFVALKSLMDWRKGIRG